MKSTGILLSSPKGKRRGFKVNFVSPDVTEIKRNEKRAKIEINQEPITIHDNSEIDELDQQNETKPALKSKLQERKTREKISIISPQPNRNAPTDEGVSYGATDLRNLFGDEKKIEDSGKIIEIVGLDSIRRGILINKSCTVHDIIERGKNDIITNEKITIRDKDIKYNNKDIAYEILDRDTPYYLQIEPGA
jgi:hypothetical protein